MISQFLSKFIIFNKLHVMSIKYKNGGEYPLPHSYLTSSAYFSSTILIRFSEFPDESLAK
jgi:hypothetical protein